MNIIARSRIVSPPVEPRSAFTLVELLVVMAIMVVMTLLLMPAFEALKGGSDVTKAAYEISGALETARAYAMANNTYVYVGFQEVDVTRDAAARPQLSGTGRIAIAVVASRDGTRGYDAMNNSLPDPAWSNYANGTNLVAVGKLRRLENMHLAQELSDVPNSGGLTRPAVTEASGYFLGGDDCQPVTPFDWPLGSAIGSGQYSFRKVVSFDPQGVARIQSSDNTDSIAEYIEIGLQQTHGKEVSPGPNVVAIQIDGMTGATRIYRP